MSFRCRTCASTLPDEARFCAVCGTPQSGNPQSFGGADKKVEAAKPAEAAPARAANATMVFQKRESGTVLILGRDPSCDIVFDNALVSQKHASIEAIQFDGQSWLLLRDLGSTHGTVVNGETQRESRISLVDEVRLGTVPVSLVDPRIVQLLLHRKGELGGTQTAQGAGQEIVIGRDANACDVVINDTRVERRHIRIRLGASSGTASKESDAIEVLGIDAPFAIDTPKFQLRNAVLPSYGLLILNGFPLPIAALLAVITGVDGASGIESVRVVGSTSILGRDPSCDVVLSHPSVSARHLSIERHPEGWLVVDLHSANGTFVDGFRLTPDQSVLLPPGSRVQLGAKAIVLARDGAAVGRSGMGIDVRNISVVVHDRQTNASRALLDDVSFSVLPSELVGMLGPSGAGKTTLLMTLLGIVRPSAGQVMIGETPLLEAAQSLRNRIGYVPQDDIVHGHLTVYEALYYSCRLRLPKMTLAQMDVAIKRTLRDVGLFESRHVLIGSPEEKTLSGGQRRRVNLAVELVTNPSLLVLDEPTSGLSWTDAADVVATLKRLSQDGRTVLLTIHQPDFREYEKFDCVAILGRGGKLVFFGPPAPESYAFFGATPQRPREMFDHVEQLPADDWRQRFVRSETYRRYIVARSEREPNGEAQAAPEKPSGFFGQYAAVLSRSIKLTLRNRVALILLLIQAPLLGLLIGLTAQGALSFRGGAFGCKDASDAVDYCSQESGLACPSAPLLSSSAAHSNAASAIAEPRSAYMPPRIPTATEMMVRALRVRDPRTSLVALLMALFLPMVIASSNALVSERTIYERERLAGLHITSYVAARFSVLALLGCVVSALHLAVALPLLELTGNTAAYFAVAIMVTSAASAMGLALSAAVRNPVSALWGINFLVIPQLLFAGSITRLHGVLNVLSYGTVTRYALEALARIDLESHAVLHACQIERYMENFPGFARTLATPLRFAFFGTQAILWLSLALTALLLRLRDRR